MDYLYEIALSVIPGIGSRRARAIIDHYGKAENVFRLSPEEQQIAFAKHPSVLSALKDKHTLLRAEAEIAFCNKHNIDILYYKDERYPQRLNSQECDDSPIILYYKGTAELNPERSIAIVGTRRATEYGHSCVERLLKGLASTGITIVSGLAAGIDSTAHREALAHGLPTIAVVAHGLDRIYPASNRQLAQNIVRSNGGIITEYMSHSPINPGQFPARNRIIAALADGVVVAEAGNKGGALITANIAQSYERDVMAFPGRAGDNTYEGCNRIIATHVAQLIESHEDLLATMRWDTLSRKKPAQTALPINLTADEQKIMSLMPQNDTISLDQLKELSGFTLPQIVSTMLTLELKNLCKTLPGNRYKAI